VKFFDNEFLRRSKLDRGLKRVFIISLSVLSILYLIASPTRAEEYIVFERPLNLLGYATQGGAFSLIGKNKYDTEQGLQSALMNLFVEGDYKISNELKFYSSSM